MAVMTVSRRPSLTLITHSSTCAAPSTYASWTTRRIRRPPVGVSLYARAPHGHRTRSAAVRLLGAGRAASALCHGAGLGDESRGAGVPTGMAAPPPLLQHRQ